MSVSKYKINTFKFWQISLLILSVFVVLSIYPVNEVKAQCTNPVTVASTANTSVGTVESTISGVATTLATTITTVNTTLNTNLKVMLQKYEVGFKNRVASFFMNTVNMGLKPMVSEIVTGKLLGTFQNAKKIDAKQTQQVQSMRDQRQLQYRMQYRPDAADYRFDTKARFLRFAEQISRTAGSSYSQLFARMGTNAEGEDSVKGDAVHNLVRWGYYQEFCNPLANNGNAGCEKTAIDDKSGLTVTPSKTIFGYDTIDFHDKPYLVNAIRELILNMNGFDVSNSTLAAAVGSASGKASMMNKRGYLAKMDALNSMPLSLVAERFPTEDNASGSSGSYVNPIQETREAVGASYASGTPSLYEIRKAVVEELRNPEYYKGLLNNKYTVDRKEIYLKAYSIMFLNKLIEKQERISNAYAIEAAGELMRMKATGKNVSSISN